jgi:hypothetical protein
LVEDGVIVGADADDEAVVVLETAVEAVVFFVFVEFAG